MARRAEEHGLDEICSHLLATVDTVTEEEWQPSSKRRSVDAAQKLRALHLGGDGIHRLSLGGFL